jgi:UTP--glucose-1-phosphate uridylyltransferase
MIGKVVVRKALIPIAGQGTRLMPLTRAVPKAMFPLVDSTDKVKSVLHVICEEAASAGTEHIGVVVSPWHIEMVRAYLDAVCEDDSGKLAARIECITQSSPRGFGDAVLQGRSFVGDDPFMLLLGDHIQMEDPGKPACSVQVSNAFCSTDAVAMVGAQTVRKDELSKVGVASGVQIRENIYRCTNFVEKPDLATARAKLVTAGLAEDTFLAHCGIYIFTPEVFDCLAQVSETAEEEGKEVELADAQALLLEKYPERYYLCKIAGRAYDLGTPAGYADAQAAFRGRC